VEKLDETLRPPHKRQLIKCLQHIEFTTEYSHLAPKSGIDIF